MFSRIIVSILGVLTAALILPAPANAALEKWDVRVVGAKGVALNNLSDADKLLAGTLPSRFDVSAQLDTLNFNLADPYRGGMAAHDARFPGVTAGHQRDFALEATGFVEIPQAGTYTFDVNSDDGFRLQIGDNVVSHVGQRYPRNSYATFTFPEAGIFPTTVTYFQHHLFAELELFSTAGTYRHFHQAGADFQLVGDTADRGLALVQALNVGSAVPEPTAVTILIVGGAGAMLRRKCPGRGLA